MQLGLRTATPSNCRCTWGNVSRGCSDRAEGKLKLRRGGERDLRSDVEFGTVKATIRCLLVYSVCSLCPPKGRAHTEIYLLSRPPDDG